MSVGCTRGRGPAHAACGRKVPGDWSVEVRVDGDGAARLVGPMCADCWSELAGAGFGPSLAVDSFTPPAVLARLAATGSAGELVALASRGAVHLSASVAASLAAAGVEVPADGVLVDLLEVRAFADTSTPVVSVRKVSKLMLAGVAIVTVAAVVATLAATRVLHSADTSSGTTLPATTANPEESSTSSSTSTTSTSTSSTSSTTSSTSTTSVPVSSTVATTVAVVPTSPAVTTRPTTAPTSPATVPPTTKPPTTTAPPVASWVTAATDSCTSASGVSVTVSWSPSSGSVSSSRLKLNGVVVATGGSSVSWSGDGAAASGTWAAEIKVSGSWSGQMSMAGCA